MMHRPLNDITMNTAMTINPLNPVFNNINIEIKPFLWSSSDSRAIKSFNRIGLGKLSTINVNNVCGNDVNYSNISMASKTPMTECASCAPRRVSFTHEGEDESDSQSQQLPTLLHTGNRKTKKAVRFSLQPKIDIPKNNQERPSQIAWNGVLTEEHCKELWYQKEELAAIKHAAKVIIAKRNKAKRNPDTSSEEQEALIGLERFNKQRAISKKNTIRCILMAQHEMRQPRVQLVLNNYGISKEDYIQKISFQRTEWSRNAAIDQGFNDYCAVHDPLAPLFGDSNSKNGNTYLDDDREGAQNYNELIFGKTTFCTTNSKRQIGSVYDTYNEQSRMIDDFSSSGRRVRCRTTPQL